MKFFLPLIPLSSTSEKHQIKWRGDPVIASALHLRVSMDAWPWVDCFVHEPLIYQVFGLCLRLELICLRRGCYQRPRGKRERERDLIDSTINYNLFLLQGILNGDFQWDSPYL